MTTIIVTRPVSKQKAALSTFKHAGFDVFSAPCFDAISNPNLKPEWLTQAAENDILVILSSHVIDAVLQSQLNNKVVFQPNKQTKVIAIGEAVAAKWRSNFDHPITTADGNSEAVIALLTIERPQSIAVLTAVGGREVIKSFALKHSINYFQLNCYIRQAVHLDTSAWEQMTAHTNDFVLTANSGELLSHIKNQLPTELWLKLTQQPLVTGAKRITDLAHEMGFNDVITAKSPSNQDMLSALNGG